MTYKAVLSKEQTVLKEEDMLFGWLIKANKPHKKKNQNQRQSQLLAFLRDHLEVSQATYHLVLINQSRQKYPKSLLRTVNKHYCSSSSLTRCYQTRKGDTQAAKLW